MAGSPARYALLLVITLLAIQTPGAAGRMYCGDDNCYELLGLASDATEGEVKRAYRTLAKRYHPDKNKGDGQAEAAAMFVRIAEAYEVVGDEELRRSYDYALAHPEEMLGNQFRYYRARYQPRIPVSWVLSGTALVFFVIECALLHTSAQRVMRQFRALSNTVGEARLRIKARQQQQQQQQQAASSRAKISAAELEREIDVMIRELQAKGYFPPFSFSQTTVVRLPRWVWCTAVDCLARRSSSRQREDDDACEAAGARGRARAAQQRHSRSMPSTYPADVVYPRMQLRQQRQGGGGGSSTPSSATSTALPPPPLPSSSSSAAAAGAVAAQEWTEADSGHLARALSKFSGGTRGRWDAIARTMNNKTGRLEGREFYIKWARRLERRRQSAATAAASSPAGVAGGGGVAAATATAAAADPVAAAVAAAAASKQREEEKEVAAAGGWTAAQQRQLEDAMEAAADVRDAKERWRAIGARVAGKSAKECVVRYRELRAALGGNAAGAGAKQKRA